MFPKHSAKKASSADNSPLKEGDVVQLRSGGPSMTVESLDNGTVNCIWFKDGIINRAYFQTVVLCRA